MARSFASASAQYLRIASGLGGLRNPLTFHCWYYSTDMASVQMLMALNNLGSTSGNYLLMLRGDLAGDPARIYKSSDSGAQFAAANTTTSYSNGAWGTACGLFASTTLRSVVVNAGGSAVNGSTVSDPTPDSFTLGVAESSSGFSSYANCAIAFPAVWNVSLSADEITALYKGAHPFTIRPDALVAFWPLDEKTGGARDIVGGYDLTASASAPTWVPDPPVLVRRPRRSQVWMGGAVAGAGGGKGFPFPPPMRGFIHMLVR